MILWQIIRYQVEWDCWNGWGHIAAIVADVALIAWLLGKCFT